MFFQTEIDGNKAWLIEIYQDASIGYGIIEDMFFFGTSKKVLEMALTAKDSPLSDNPTFKKTTNPIPHESNGLIYLDVDRIYQLLDRLMTQADRDAATPYIDRIQSISIATEPMEDSDILRGLIYIHTK